MANGYGCATCVEEQQLTSPAGHLSLDFLSPRSSAQQHGSSHLRARIRRTLDLSMYTLVIPAFCRRPPYRPRCAIVAACRSHHHVESATIVPSTSHAATFSTLQQSLSSSTLLAKRLGPSPSAIQYDRLGANNRQANMYEQCLAINPRPLRFRNVHHVGHHIPRTTPPAHLACTKRSATGVQPRVDDLLAQIRKRKNEQHLDAVATAWSAYAGDAIAGRAG
jgi:hypothetical protein